MKDNTLREIDDILKHFYVVARPLPNGNISINGTTYAIDVPPEVALKDQLEALLAEEVRKARIDELKRLREVTGLKTPPVSRYQDGYHDAMAVIYHTSNTRIKQLEKGK